MVEIRLQKTSSRLKQCLKGGDKKVDKRQKLFLEPASGPEVLLIEFYVQHSLSIRDMKY